MGKAPRGKRRWRAYIMRGKTQLLGIVEATDKQEALRMAFEAFEVREADRFRVIVQPD
jgi:hypothetical protein